jgi:2-dehydro-3-deoxyphosphogluconate aldolase/(4S)-4-hydroxy-2-oxoglutarate aldolase
VKAAARDEVVSALAATGIVAVVRSESSENLVRLAQSLADGGVRLVEITMTVPSALHVIERAVHELGSDVVIGAGTVLDGTAARMAIAAGAGFVVGPCLCVEMIEVAHLYGVAAVPGCLSPTEIAQAWRAGADVVKLFPGRVATPGYFRDMRGPFPQVRLMPTGNVDLDTAAEYIRAGAVAVGVGRALVDPTALQSGDWDTISETARRFCHVIKSARGEPR